LVFEHDGESPPKTIKFRLPVWKYGTGKEQARCLDGSNLKGIYMTKMTLVSTGIRHPIDGGTERHGMSALTIAAIAVAVFVGGGMMFYSLSSSPSTTVTTGYSPIVDDFKSLEASRPAPAPPTTTGQGGERIAN
jgi:hypothetical protein